MGRVRTDPVVRQLPDPPVREFADPPVPVLAGAVAGVLAQLAVLGTLAGSVGLGAPGWILGLGFGLTVNCWLAAALIRAGSSRPGPADWVTLTRATLVGGSTALVADSFSRPVPLTLLVSITTVALLLDAVDGWTARRTGTVSAVGARFDMEVDAFLILVLSVYDVRLLGGWVLAIGAARYLYVAAGWILPWLGRPVPPRYWRKVVAAIQGIVLTAVMAEVVPHPVAVLATVGALALLAESFGRDIVWLWQRRPKVPQATAQRTDRRRRLFAAPATVLAAALVWFALLGPDDISTLRAGDLFRIPIEAVVVIALVLVLPARPARLLVLAVGVLLALTSLLRILDIGFRTALNRPFNPLTDWAYLGPALRLLGGSVGQWAGIAAVVAAALLVVAVAVLVPLSVRRLTRLATRDRGSAFRFVAAFAVLWMVSAVIGLQVGPGVPVAAAGVAQLTYDEVRQVRASIADQQAFAAQIADDPVAGMPAEKVLTALHGKDVVLVFVESYGRVAIEDPVLSPPVDAVLDAGAGQLAAAGFRSESAFLTSPTFGGISWLAHSTVQSGLWVDSQQRYDQLLSSDRFTLGDAFGWAGWRTVLTAPANTEDWPQASTFYHFDQVYDRRNIGYRGAELGFATPPDQYTLSALQHTELTAADRRPVLAEVDLLSSHVPWTEPPPLVDWAAVGDGSIFTEPAARTDDDTGQARVAYARTIAYSLSSVISFVQHYGTDDLVVIMVGDHQPATVVTGPDAGNDVPISIIAQDPAVFDRTAAWGWQAGLNPRPDAPVWPMDQFRDRFLAAFSG